MIGEQGLFTEFGIKTSTFFAYSLLSKLTGTVTQLGDSYISVRDTESLTLLAYNTNKEKLTFNLNISNVKKRNAIIRHNFKDVSRPKKPLPMHRCLFAKLHTIRLPFERFASQTA